MRVEINARQASALERLFSAASNACVLSPLGNPGDNGPLFVDLGTLSVIVTEAGVCCLHDAEWIGAVE